MSTLKIQKSDGTFEHVKVNANVNITKSNIGLDKVDNTSDLDKPISTATQTAIDGKASVEDLNTHVDNTNLHKQANNIVQTGLYANAEGDGTVASGNNSHAEGGGAIANGEASHAEGGDTLANGMLSHAEGLGAIALGDFSHAEGHNIVAGGAFSHAEGEFTLSANGSLYNVTSFNNTAKTITVDNVNGLVVGDLLQVFVSDGKPVVDVEISNINNLVLTLNTTLDITELWTQAIKTFPTAESNPAHAEGYNTISVGGASHAEGYQTIANSQVAHAEGVFTTVTGDGSHAEGYGTLAIGAYAHAECYATKAIGDATHVEGFQTVANGDFSHAGGVGNTANAYSSTIIGRFGKGTNGNTKSAVTTDDAFVIGNGSNNTSRSNALRVTFQGQTYGLSSFNATGADYAEYFEWLDENSENEDRVGYFVTLDGTKIRKANSNDNYILGIISVNPSVIGDSYQDDWNEKYITDEWGRIQYHYVDVPAVVNKNGEEVKPARQDYVPVINPKWNPEEEYTPREKRKEWSAVGMMGKLLVRDDGTCQVNGYCKSNDEGIATSSENGYRVMERVTDNIIRVLVK